MRASSSFGARYSFTTRTTGPSPLTRTPYTPGANRAVRRATSAGSAAAGALTVSPNPATGGSVVLVRGPRPLRPGQLLATDALGRAMPLNVTTEGEALRLDVHTWPAGIYWLQADGRRTKLVR